MTRKYRTIVAFLVVVVLCVGSVSAAVSFPQVAKLTTLDAAPGDSLGYSVSISGDTVLVGAPFDDDLGGASGAAYIFERNSGGPDAWGQVAKLLAPGGVAADWFGIKVALDGDTAVVGATVGDFSRLGFAYVFERDAEGPGAWGAVARLDADDGVLADGYGGSVAVSGNLAAIGAVGADLPGGGGAVYIYERDAGGPGAWGQIAKLTPAAACGDDVSYCGWFADFAFGGSVSISGDTIAVGDTQVSNGGSYVFRRNKDGSWQRLGRPTSADFSGGDQFGTSVAISGRTLLVPAPSDDDLGAQSGSAYVFNLDPQSRPPWTEVAKLTAPDGEQGDLLGRSADLDGHTAVIGATQSDSGRDWQGEAYVFRNTQGGWKTVANLVAADGEPFDIFGWSVGISGDTVVVGAKGDDSSTGAAYIFQAMEAGPASEDAEKAGPSATRPGPTKIADTTLPVPESLRRMEHLAPPSGGAPAGGQFCFEFISRCDLVELTLSGSTLTGSWRNVPPPFICDTFDFDVSGKLVNGGALVWCDATTGPCPEGLTYGMIIDWPLDGSMIMLQHDGHWNSWIDELTYVSTPGLCE